MTGVLILFGYFAVMLGVVFVGSTHERVLSRFLVWDRKMGAGISALSIASTWIWAPSLFVSADKAYQAGWVGLFWFTVPNVLCLILFVPFAKAVRRALPRGYTIAGYMETVYGSRWVGRAYLFELSMLAVCSTAVQLLAGGQMLSHMSGLPHWALVVVLAIGTYFYAQRSGLRADVLTDAVQYVIIAGGSVSLVLLSLSVLGPSTLIAGLHGKSGVYGSLFSPAGIWEFWAFGLPVTIGLLSGPFGDQSFWQRVFAIDEKRVGLSFVLGSLAFAVVPLAMGSLGFIAAGTGIDSDTGSNLALVRSLFPALVPLFDAVVLSGLLSTIDSNLCAVASLSTAVSKKPTLRLSRALMLALLAVAVVIANIPGLTILHLFLFYGAIRATTLFPTVITVLGGRLAPAGIVAGVLVGTVASVWLSIEGHKAAAALAAVLLPAVLGFFLRFR